MIGAGPELRARRDKIRLLNTAQTAILLGSEGAGLHELARKHCDFLVSIPTTGPVRSLNVSVASGVVLFEALRQRRAAR